MDRIPIEEPGELHALVAGVYNLVFEAPIEPETLELYYIEAGRVEAEIDFPRIGVNREMWEERWSPERKLEVLLHEFAHVEEAAGELDHGLHFYARLADLTARAEAEAAAVEALFGEPLDFDAVREHVVDSVNEYTVESDVDTVENRRRVLREQLSADQPG